MVRKRKTVTKSGVRTKFILKTPDGYFEEVSPGVVKQSAILNDMFDQLNECVETPIPNLTGSILKVVVAFCRLHENEPPYVPVTNSPVALSYDDARFLRDHEKIFNELIYAGDYLCIPRLVDAVILYIRDNYIAGQRIKFIPEYLGLPPREKNDKTYEKAVRVFVSMFPPKKIKN